MSRTMEALHEQNEKELFERADMEAVEREAFLNHVSHTWSEYEAKFPDADYGTWKYGPGLVDWDEEPQG